MLFYAYHNENAGSLQSCLLNTTNIITISGLAIHCDDELLTSENAHRWGKDHCTAGLQFYKVALDCFTKYKKNFLHWSVPVLLNWRSAVQWSFPHRWVSSAYLIAIADKWLVPLPTMLVLFSMESMFTVSFAVALLEVSPLQLPLWSCSRNLIEHLKLNST